MDKTELRQKSYAAKALLENSDFKLAMETVRLQAFRDWSNSKPDENNLREEQYYLLQAIAKVTENLQSLADNITIDATRTNRKS